MALTGNHPNAACNYEKQHNEQKCDKNKEDSVVVNTDAVVYPRTVVVEPVNTLIADGAVF